MGVISWPQNRFTIYVIVASAHSTDNFYAITDEEAEEFTLPALT